MDGNGRSKAVQFLQLSWTKLFISRRKQLERDPNALGVENFERRDDFRDRNDVDSTKEYAESLADRCKSRPSGEMSNAKLVQALGQRKWRLFTLTKLFSRRTLKLMFPNYSRVDSLLICSLNNVFTTHITRDIDGQIFRTVIRLSTSLNDDFFRMTNEYVRSAYETLTYIVYSAYGAGGGVARASRESGVKFQTLISQKRLEITLRKCYANLKSWGRSFDWARFQSSRTTYQRASGSRSEFGPWTTGIVGNDSFPHQMTFGEVCNPLNTEIS